MMKMMLVMAGILSTVSPAAADTHVLIVNGISKDPADRAVKSRIVQDLKRCLLNQGGVDPNRLTVLTGEDAQAGKIETTMTTLASTVGPGDRFIYYYVGQANAVVDSLRFNVVGEDVTGQQIAQWLNRIEARHQLVVLDCPHAAMVAKEMTRPDRILVLASTEEEAFGTRLSLHLVPALTQKEADTNLDRRISVLEAFTAAARGIEQWYRDNTILPTETPNLEDNADGVPSERPWRYVVDGGDGLAASEFILATL